MVVDTSAIVAVLLGETERRAFLKAISTADWRSMSAVSLVEASLVMMTRHGPTGVADLDDLIAVLGIAVEPVTLEHARAAREAHQRFGRGRHPAKLNLGDCFAYALAVTSGEPLLYKGDDFARTDVARA